MFVLNPWLSVVSVDSSDSLTIPGQGLNPESHQSGLTRKVRWPQRFFFFCPHSEDVLCASQNIEWDQQTCQEARAWIWMMREEQGGPSAVFSLRQVKISSTVPASCTEHCHQEECSFRLVLARYYLHGFWNDACISTISKKVLNFTWEITCFKARRVITPCNTRGRLSNRNGMAEGACSKWIQWETLRHNTSAFGL